MLKYVFLLYITGTIFSVSLPVVKQKKLLGVVGLDITVEEILNELNVLLLNPYNYLFIVTNKGE